jgi:magnesium chelatase subunit D
VHITNEQYAAFACLSQTGGCAGHRCEIVLAETAKAVAAWNGRETITNDDIRLAAKFVLPHRLRERLPTMRQPEDTGGLDNDETEESTPMPQNAPVDGLNSSDKQDANNQRHAPTEDEIQDVGNKPELSLMMETRRSRSMLGSGKRNKAKTDHKSGRYVKARFPRQRINDIALDATLRTAASRQYGRERSDVAISIRKDDIREKVREKRTGVTILFVVDASGSMGARRRMAAVKGAVLSLLEEAYQKRDKVGIVAFRNTKAEILLNITRSVNLAQKQLRSLPTGGKTPLAAGLMLGYRLLLAEKIRNPDVRQYLVLITDGKANVSLTEGDAGQEAMAMAKKIGLSAIDSLVLDTEQGYIRFGFAEMLAHIMNSIYTRLDAVSKNEIMSNVRDFVKIK